MNSIAIRVSLAALLISSLLACSDGPDPLIEGFAATGAALANATVTAKCVGGPELTGTTDAAGAFQLNIGNGQTAPCIVRVTGGGTTLHSFASSAGRLNVTPLTELSVAQALGSDPATAFAGFDSAKSSAIAQGLTAAKASIKTQVEALTGQTLQGDLFTATFKVGDPDDVVLDKLKEKLEEVERPLSDLLAVAVQGKPLMPRVKVMGDSLSDVGTFGLKFTVQGSFPTGPGSADIWVDVVARELQRGRLCPYFRMTGSVVASRSDCTNFAVGGGRINNLSDPSDPRSIIQQLKTSAQVHGAYSASDVLLIDGGGNDAADLAAAYLAAGTNPTNFQTLLLSVLGQDATATLLAGGSNGAVVAGLAYMEGLADRFADAIQVHAVDKGARRVLVMNLPDIALTPRFGAVLAGVAAQTGSQDAANQVKGLIQAWINAFNQKLASRFLNSAAVAVMDFNATFRAQVASPTTFGFTEASQTACPVTGTEPTTGLPAYTFPTCTAAALSSTENKPSSDWWQTYLFSDGFHPTPRAHAAAATSALILLEARGWK